MQENPRSLTEPPRKMLDSMLFMPSQIKLYRQMSVLSARMVRAARASDWDSLIELETDVAALRAALKETVELNVSTIESGEKRQLIQSILQDDAEVRRHTEPWMEKVRTFLGQDHQRVDINQPFADLSIIANIHR